MRRRALPPLAALLLLLLALAPRAAAQGAPSPLEPFVARVASLWAYGDAGGLVELAPSDGRILLDLRGRGAEPVPERHAAAALRILFREHATVTVRTARVNLSGGQPVSGFGELAWVARAEGVTVNRSAVVYVGAVWEEGGWRLRELRLRY